MPLLLHQRMAQYQARLNRIASQWSALFLMGKQHVQSVGRDPGLIHGEPSRPPSPIPIAQTTKPTPIGTMPGM